MPQAFSKSGVLDLVERVDAFHLPVRQADLVVEQLGVKTGDGDERGLVDGRRQDSAAVAGNWTTSLDSQSSIRHRIIDVTEGKEAEYSSSLCMLNCSSVAVDFSRTFAVSCVPHCRAKVSKATSRTRLCWRGKVVGRRKS